jgi:DNA polymerase-3 subunit gamma/tau
VPVDGAREAALVKPATDSAEPQVTATVSAQEQAARAWAELLPGLGLQGAVLNFARNCCLLRSAEQPWCLLIDQRHEALIQDAHLQRIEAALNQVLGPSFGQPIKLRLEIVAALADTPESLQIKQQRAQRDAAEQALRSDPFVQLLEKRFGATMDRDSVKALP